MYWEMKASSRTTSLLRSRLQQVPQRFHRIGLHGEVKSSLDAAYFCLFACFIGETTQSLDSVSSDSDLDSVCTEKIQQHVNRQAGEGVQKTFR